MFHSVAVSLLQHFGSEGDWAYQPQTFVGSVKVKNIALS